MNSYSTLKKNMDYIISLFLIWFCSPILLLVGIIIKLDSKGPVFFKQKRIGREGKIFKVIKFRTMCDKAENMGMGLSTASQDPRITKVGKVLRKTSIDELPQLFNVLKGDMSLVGPRPAPPIHLEKYSKKDFKRLEVRPGLTGWAQVNGRNKLTWEERIDRDKWYVENLSLLLDIKIIIKTIKVLFLFEGVYSGRNDFKIKKHK